VRSERKIFRIYSEGRVTEPEYIEALRQLPVLREQVSVEIRLETVGLDPLSLVRAATDDKRQGRSEVDEYWCVFDVESPVPHPSLGRALELAASEGVQVAVSNPCFELWLILHHRAQSAYLTTEQASRLRCDLDGSEDKHIDAEFYVSRRAVAVQRSRALRLRHRGNGSGFPHDNPSSSVDILIGHLEGSRPV
jgi:hypothetical protein